jgi:hypothetical protein
LKASHLLGHLKQEKIRQLGERLESARTPFAVLEEFAHLRDPQSVRV